MPLAIEETSPLPRSVQFNAGAIVLFVTVLVPFLPYAPAGYRAEHLLAPILAAGAFCFLLDRSAGTVRWLAFPLLALLTAVAASTVGSLVSSETGSEASVINMLIRLAMPPLLLTGFVYLLERYDISFDRVIKAIFLSAIVIGVVSLLSISSVLSDLFAPFVAEDGVWRGSRGTGRYPGIFNQPIEAGLYFGMATLCLAHVYRAVQVRPAMLIIGSIAILLGGSVSLSKTFFLGLSILLVYLLAVREWRIIAAVVVGSVVVIFLAYTVLDPSGAYFDSLVGLLVRDGPIAALTAGRFGVTDAGGTEMATRLIDAASSSWPNLIFGFGLGSFMPLDSGFFEYGYQGGLLGLSAYLSFFIFFFWLALKHIASCFGKLMFFVTLFGLVASFGGPTLTANRAGYLLLLLFAAAVVEGRRRDTLEVALGR